MILAELPKERQGWVWLYSDGCLIAIVGGQVEVVSSDDGISWFISIRRDGGVANDLWADKITVRETE